VSIQIDGAKSTYLTGESGQLTAIPLDASGNPVAGAAAATWESFAPSVATVGADGTVRALATGSTSIKATIGSVNATRVVTVLPPGVGAVVTMPGLTFAPFTVTINKGQAVYFDFPSLGHNVIFASMFGVPADIQVAAGVTVSRTFSTAGTFPYDCTIHNGMKGEVVVNP
jgi:plastocyanin